MLQRHLSLPDHEISLEAFYKQTRVGGVRGGGGAYFYEIFKKVRIFVVFIDNGVILGKRHNKTQVDWDWWLNFFPQNDSAIFTPAFSVT